MSQIAKFHCWDAACIGLVNPGDPTDRLYVLHADHLAAIDAASSYDEAAERKAAVEACPASGCDWGSFWKGWKLCAKARAKAAGCL